MNDDWIVLEERGKMVLDDHEKTRHQDTPERIIGLDPFIRQVR